MQSKSLDTDFLIELFDIGIWDKGLIALLAHARGSQRFTEVQLESELTKLTQCLMESRNERES